MRSLIAVAFVAIVALAAAPAHAREVWAPHGSTAVAVFDSAGGAATVPPGLTGLPAPRELAFTPDAARFYLSSATAATDLITGSVPAHTASSVAGTGGPSGQDNPVVSPDGTRAYVIEQFDLLAIDTATNTVVDREFVTGSPGGVAVSVDGAKVFVGDAGASGIYVYDTASGTVSASAAYATGPTPSNLAVTPDGSKLVASNNGGSPGTVSIVDLGPGTTRTVTGLAGFPRDVAVSPDSRYAYVGNGNTREVKKIDLASATIVGTLSWTGGGFADDVAITPDGTRLFVTAPSDPLIQVFDLSNGSALTPVTIPANPSDVAVVPNQGPAAAFGATASPARSATTFDARGSTDPDGTVARYDWDFGDGSTLPNGGPTPSHTYASAGNFTVSLTVTDNEGGSTERLHGGQSLLHRGGPAARTSKTVAIAPRDALGPRLKVSTPRNRSRYRSSKLRRIRGTGVDRAQTGAKAVGMASVRYGIRRQQRVRGRTRCRALRSTGRLGKLARCSKTTPLKAKGTRLWSAALKRRLPAGAYVLRMQATDRNGNKGRAVSVTFKVR